MRRTTLVLAACLLLLATAAPPVGAAPSLDSSDLQRVIVQVRDGTTGLRGLADEVTALHGGRTGATFRHAINGFVAELPRSAIAALARNPQVISISPDYPIRATAQETPTGFDRIDADLVPRAGVPLALDCPSGAACTDVDIAIIDTGVADHPDLNVIHRVDCTSIFGFCSDNSGFDGSGHGTHVAGIAAAIDNDIGIVGVAPGARIWSVKVLGDDGVGFLSSLIGGIDWVTARSSEIDVANMSLTGEFSNSTFDTAIANSVAAGITFAVGAGNDSTNAAAYSPASHPDVIAVSALADADGAGGGLGVFLNRPDESDDMLATFSNYGAVVDMAAPGVNIRSTWNDGGYAIKSGTSMASPQVAGAAALYIALHGRDTNNDTLVDGADVAKVMNDLLADAKSQTDPCGFGGDPDAASYPEPLLTVNGPAFGGDGTCTIATADQSPPAGPSFTAVADGFTVQIDWDEATDPESGILSYQLWRDTVPPSGEVLVAETNHTVLAQLDRPEPGTDFSYEINAVNRQGTAGPRSGPLVVTISAADRSDAGWWPLDDGGGTVAVDSTAWKRDGALVGGGVWDPVGKVGGALTFDGNNDRVDLDAAILDGAGDVTVALWVRTTKTGIQAFVSGANSGNDAEFELVPISNTAVRFYTGQSSATYVVWNVASFADNQWHHFAVTRDDGNDQVTLFIDGLSQGAQTTTLETLSIDPGGMMLGQEQDSVGGGFDSSQAFVGTMDEVHLYTRLLTNQEISDLAGVLVDTDPPSPPAALTAAPGDAQVTLDWADNPESDLDSYTVRRAEIDGGPYSVLASGVAESRYVDTTASNDTTYYYVVTAVDTSGNESSHSHQASATPSAAIGPAPIDFLVNPVLSYGGTGQDRTGTVEILDDGATLRLTGNLWKKIAYPYTITANTVLEFDFSSSTRGEIHGIGFDTDNTISSDRTFELYGSQTWGLQDFRTYASPDVAHYVIPIGQFYTGSFASLIFANDHDVSSPTGESTYTNITIYEKPPPEPGVIDFSVNPVLSYGGTGQDRTGTVEILDGGATLRITGNLWKKIAYPYTITANTMLEFDFSSSTRGEIHGIGFDTDNTISSDRTFELFGSQTWGLQDFRTYASPDVAHYVIPIGQFYTGSFASLVFANDHDVSSPTGESTYTNITIYESG